MEIPKGMMPWLAEAAPNAAARLPARVKKDIGGLTKYLLKDADEDLCESLLDVSNNLGTVVDQGCHNAGLQYQHSP